MSGHNKTLGISYALHMLLKSTAQFFTVVHSMSWEASTSDSEKKLSFGLNFCSYLIGSFRIGSYLKQILTHRLLKGTEVGLKLFFI